MTVHTAKCGAEKHETNVGGNEGIRDMHVFFFVPSANGRQKKPSCEKLCIELV